MVDDDSDDGGEIWLLTTLDSALSSEVAHSPAFVRSRCWPLMFLSRCRWTTWEIYFVDRERRKTQRERVALIVGVGCFGWSVVSKCPSDPSL